MSLAFEARPLRERQLDAEQRVADVAIQVNNLASFLELQNKRLCSVRGVATAWARLAAAVQAMREVVADLQAAEDVECAR